MDVLPGKREQHRIKSLLLLVNLFVARTLGDCPTPLLTENIVLTTEALLMNEFSDGVEISLTCSNGYVKDSGSGTLRCTDGTWSDLDLTCKKKDCGLPPSRPNMTFNLSQGTLFGAQAVVSCDKGYYVIGSRHIHCYNAGWTGSRTKCEIVTCEIPEKLANGKNSWNSNDLPKYGENIQFFCNEGYTLTGNDSIMCTEDGEYDLPAPQCLGVTKEDVFTTKLVTTPTSTTTPPTQETSVTSTTSTSTTSSGHRDSTVTASASPTRGGDIFTSEDNVATTTLSPTVPYYSQEGRNDDIVNTKKDAGYTPVIISVVCVSLAVFIVALFIHKLLLKRKGSYDTREDLKPELLQFQNL